MSGCCGGFTGQRSPVLISANRNTAAPTVVLLSHFISIVNIFRCAEINPTETLRGRRLHSYDLRLQWGRQRCRFSDTFRYHVFDTSDAIKKTDLQIFNQKLHRWNNGEVNQLVSTRWLLGHLTPKTQTINWNISCYESRFDEVSSLSIISCHLSVGSIS